MHLTGQLQNTQANAGPLAGVDKSALESALERLVERAAASWPEIRFDHQRFVAHVVERLRSRDDPLQALDDLEAEDLLLSFACLTHDAKALATFDALLCAVSSRSRVARALSETDREELLQQLREMLLVGRCNGRPCLDQYHGNGSLQAWLAVVCARHAAIFYKVRQRELSCGATPCEPLSDCATDPEQEITRKRGLLAFDVALRAAAGALEPQELAVLRYSYLDHLTHEEIGRLCDIHRNTAARLLQHAKTSLLKNTRLHLGTRLRMPIEESKNVVDLIGDHLGVLFHNVLASDQLS